MFADHLQSDVGHIVCRGAVFHQHTDHRRACDGWLLLRAGGWDWAPYTTTSQVCCGGIARVCCVVVLCAVRCSCVTGLI